MAITNPEAVRFCNENVRTLADIATRYYYAARAFQNEWVAAGMASKIPNDGGETVVDGSATDGRTPITGQNVNQLQSHINDMLGDLEASSNTKLNILLQIEVNGSPNAAG